MILKVELLKNTTQELIDISPIVTSFSIKSEKTNYARTLDIKIGEAKTVTQDVVSYFPINPIELGDIVRITDEEGYELFRGLFISLSGKANENYQGYTCIDFGFYINRSENAFKFYKQSVKECIDMLFKEGNLPLAINEAPSDVIISKLYSDNVYGEIIKDFTEKIKLSTGDDYFLQFKDGNFNYIQTDKSKYEKGIVNLTEFNISLYKNQNEFDFKQIISSVSYDETIENLYNKVKVVVESENKLKESTKKTTSTKKGKKKEVKKEVKKKVVNLSVKEEVSNKSDEQKLKDEEQVKNTTITSKAIVQDEISVKRYGELMYVENIKADSINNAQTFAENKLKELNKIQSKTTVEFINAYKLDAFDLVELIEPKLKLNGVYEILSSDINYENGFIKVSAALDIVDKYEVNE